MNCLPVIAKDGGSGTLSQSGGAGRPGSLALLEQVHEDVVRHGWVTRALMVEWKVGC